MSILAIDGPAGAGKSTVARTVARTLGYRYVNTGAIYRAVALMATRRELTTEADIAGALAGLEMSFDGDRVLLEGDDVSEIIRTPQNGQRASEVSAMPAVRAGLLELQRRIALEDPKGAVLEGRDIGTVVFPDARTKIFLTATPEIRAGRRTKELEAKGDTSRTYEEILHEIKVRDERDSQREIAPLKPADDSVVVDTSGKSIKEVVAEIAAEASRGLLDK
jgi:cytidylate kinase